MNQLNLFNFTSLIIMVVPSQKRFKTIYYQSSLDALKKLLSQNGYPRGAVNYNMNDVLQKLQNPIDPNNHSSQEGNILSFTAFIFRASKQNR